MSHHKSDVINLLRTVWKNTNSATSHSWERLNHSMRAALEVAVGAGFQFSVEDFQSLSEFRFERWIGASDEWVYSLAVVEGNLSAAKAFEEWKGREPIIADGVSPRDSFNRARFCHASGPVQKGRVYVGCSLKWNGERVHVTSFNAAGNAIACSYVTGTSKIRKRYEITREAVIANRKSAKAKPEHKP